MKTPLLLLVCSLLLPVIGHSQAPALDDQAKIRKLSQTPFTLYPNAVVTDSNYPALFNRHARAGDALVVSYQDALKVSAQISDLGIQRGEVWIYVPHSLDLTQRGRRNVEGAHGIVFIPTLTNRNVPTLATQALRLSEATTILGMKLIAGMEPNTPFRPREIADLAKCAEIFTLYEPRKLSRDLAQFHRHFERVVREARGANPAIKIELAISTGQNEEATRQLAGVLWHYADQIDRIGLYSDESRESVESLELLLKVLRPEGL